MIESWGEDRRTRVKLEDKLHVCVCVSDLQSFLEQEAFELRSEG